MQALFILFSHDSLKRMNVMSYSIAKKKRTTEICPSCGSSMDGLSITYHYRKCNKCATEGHFVGVAATQEYSWVVGLLSLLGLIALAFAVNDRRSFRS